MANENMRYGLQVSFRAYVLDRKSAVFVGNDEGVYFTDNTNRILNSRFGEIASACGANLPCDALFPAGSRVLLTLPSRLGVDAQEKDPVINSATVQSSKELSVRDFARLVGNYRRAKDRGEKPSLVKLLEIQ